MNYSLALLSIIASIESVDAWGAEGHRALASVARSVLQKLYPESWEIVDSVLRANGDDFIHSSIWADVVKSRYGFTRNWHFINTPTRQCKFIRQKDCGNNDLCLSGVLDQLVHGKPLVASPESNTLKLDAVSAYESIITDPLEIAGMIPADSFYWMSLEDSDEDAHEHDAEEVSEVNDDMIRLSRHKPTEEEREARRKEREDHRNGKDQDNHKPKPQPKPQPKPSPPPNKDSKCTEKDDFKCWSPAERIKFAIHLIGDEHQPLHVAWAADRGGNDISTSLGNLHAVWDSTVIRQTIKTNFEGNTSKYINDFGMNVIKKAVEVAHMSTKDVMNFGISGAVDKWATETAQIACESAYVYRGAEVKTGANLKIETYAIDTYPVIEDRLIAGGARLAVYLHSVIQEEKKAVVRI